MPNPPFSANPVHPAIERIRNQGAALNTPMECVDCGSSYFVDMHAHEYSNSGYGTVQFRQLTVAPVPVKMCIGCSRIVTPTSSGGKSHPASTPRFQESAHLGEKFRAVLKTNANAVASKRELDSLQAIVLHNQSLIQQMMAELGAEDNTPVPIVVEEKVIIDPLALVDDGEPSMPVIVDEPKTESLSDLMSRRTGRATSTMKPRGSDQPRQKTK